MVRQYSSPQILIRFSTPTENPSFGFLAVAQWELFADLNQLCKVFSCTIKNAEQWFDEFGGVNLLQTGTKVEVYFEGNPKDHPSVWLDRYNIRKFVGFIVEDGIRMGSDTRDKIITVPDAMWCLRNAVAKVQTGSSVTQITEELTDETSENLVYGSPTDKQEWSNLHIPIVIRVVKNGNRVLQRDYVQPDEYQIAYRYGLMFFEKTQIAQNYLDPVTFDEFPAATVEIHACYGYYDGDFDISDAITEYVKYDSKLGGAGVDADVITNIIEATDMNIRINNIDWDIDSGTFEDYVQFLKDSGVWPENYKMLAYPVEIPDDPNGTPSIPSLYPMYRATPLVQQEDADIKVDHELIVEAPFSLEETYARVVVLAERPLGKDIGKTEVFGITKGGAAPGMTGLGDLADGRSGGYFSHGINLWDIISDGTAKTNLLDGDPQSLYGAVSVYQYAPDTVFPNCKSSEFGDTTEMFVDQDFHYVDISFAEPKDLEKVVIGMYMQAFSSYDYRIGRPTASISGLDVWGHSLIGNYYVTHRLPRITVLASNGTTDYFPLSENAAFFTLDPLGGGDAQIHEITNIRQQVKFLRIIFHSPWFVRVADSTGGNPDRAAFYFLSNIWFMQRGMVTDYLGNNPYSEITNSTTGTPITNDHEYPIGTVAGVTIPGIINVGSNPVGAAQELSGAQICVPTPTATPNQPYVGVIKYHKDDLIYTDITNDTTGDALAAGVEAGDWWVINNLRYRKDLSFNIRDFYRPKIALKFKNARLEKKQLVLEEERVADYGTGMQLAVSHLWDRIRNMDSFRTTIPYRPDIELGQTIVSTTENVITEKYMVTSYRYRGEPGGIVVVDLEFTNYNRSTE